MVKAPRSQREAGVGGKKSGNGKEKKTGELEKREKTRAGVRT